MSDKSIDELRKSVIPQGHTSMTAGYVASASGAMVTDEQGREFIDFAGGIGAMNVGHSHPKVVAAIQEQAARFTHTCFMVQPYRGAVELADRLCRATPGDFDKACLLVNSGAEAVENAVKIARYHTGRSAVIAFDNGYHGRTLLTMTLTSKVKPYKYGFGPFAPEVYHAPFAYCYRCPLGREHPDCGLACAEDLEMWMITNTAPDQVAAMIVEPIQGEGGFITPPPGYFQKLADICSRHGIVLISDEIQSGMGRTGPMFAMEHWGVEPDITTVAKSLAAGMPISAVVGRREIMNSVHPGGLGGTYGANPVACAAGLAVMDVFEEENLLARSVELGKRVRARFDDWAVRYELIGEVRGLGPMLGLELVADRRTRQPAADKAKALLDFCLERGLVILVCGIHGNVVRTLMPLVITDDQLENGLAIMEEGLKQLEN